MANSLFSLLPLLSAIYFVTAQQNVKHIISRGSSLTSTGNSSWLSPSGLFAFGFYQQGDNSYRVGIFLAGLPLNKSTVVWTANRDDPPVSDDVILRLTIDGELVLQQQSQGFVRDVVTLDQSISFASMLDTGNFVLYGSDQEMIWQSFDHPTDSILPGQNLTAGQELVSSKSESDHSTGLFRLKMQDDSNLVQYPVDTMDIALYAYWATYTNGIGVDVTLNLDLDGSLHLLNNSVTVLKNLTHGSSAKQRLYLMKIDSDGILRLYSFSLENKGPSSSVVWNAPANRCEPKGFCGNNAYCNLNDDDEAECACPHGFHFHSPGNWTAGCERNYSYKAEACNNSQIQFKMTQLPNTMWANEPYPVTKTSKKEECEAACLKNCDCDAAFFYDGWCSQANLPLRYGRNISTNDIIAYVKWAFPPEEMTTDNNGHQSIILVLTAGIGAGLLGMLVFLLFTYWGVRQRKNIKLKENHFKQNGGIMLQQLLHKSESTEERAKIYTEEELKKATNNYNDTNVIGQGGSGTVYKGVLADTVVAIKKSKLVDGSQIDQFVNEIVILSQIKHPNVVKLLGCCLETPVPLLVYEFVTNNTLFHHVHDEVCASSIPWDMRLKIATETAGALAHMHSAPVHIIHRDFKTTNILLDDEYTAKVSDFGISRLFSLEQTRLATLVQGTIGYIDPEYFHSGILTQKSDVYSFGVVLAELLTGSKVVSFCREEKYRNLGMYFLSALEDDRLYTILEPRVREEGNAEQLEGAAEIVKKCLRIEGAKRPTMKEVEEELVQLRELKIENYTSMKIGPYVKEPLIDEVIQCHDSNAISESAMTVMQYLNLP